MEKKIFGTIGIIILLTLAMIPNVSSQPASPVGVGGYIINNYGTLMGGLTVNITNNNTGDYIVVTSNTNGIYACGINASNGDILYGVCAAGLGITGDNQTAANLSNVTQWLNITVTSPVWANFSWEPEEPVVDEDVNFTDKSDGSITSWSWNFGDGYTSTFRNPVHSFSKAKDYIVTLTISDGSNTGIISKTITISEPTVEPPVPPVVSDLSYWWFVVLILGIVATILVIYIFGFARKKKKPAN